MEFRTITSAIGRGFRQAKQETFRGHPIAKQIRNAWPDALAAALTRAGHDLGEITLDSSPGLGQWSDSPWLALFHPAVTDSATKGFYPVFLFEPEFHSVCLVLGQGAQKLVGAVGRKQALIELEQRAAKIRSRAGKWKELGFSEGPFSTMKIVAREAPTDFSKDTWSIAVAFGKRYDVAAMPSDHEIANDVSSMLQLYESMATDPSLRFGDLDDEVDALKEAGELPKESIDGAKRVILHKKFESRVRNKSLIAAVKKLLGTRCQACEFSFRERYGAGMDGYIEAHHLVPLATLPEVGARLKPTAQDFMVLCSNCHRAIHRAGCPDLATFRSLIAQESSTELRPEVAQAS